MEEIQFLIPTHRTQDLFNILLTYFTHKKKVAEESSQVPQSYLSQKSMRYVNLLNTVCDLPLRICKEGEPSLKGSGKGM